jgi:two-component system sensor histidine kinase YesM
MILKYLSNLKIKQKFLLSYFLLIILPLALLSGLTSNRVSKMVEEHTTFSTRQAIDQTHSFLSYKLYRIANISDIIRIDKNVSSILVKEAAVYDLYEQVKDMNYLRDYLSSFEDSNDIYRVKLYVNDNFIYSTENVNLSNISKAKSSSWYSILEEYGTKNFWSPAYYLEDSVSSDSKLLSVAAAIRNPDNYSEHIGFLRVDFQKQAIEDIIKKANAADGSFTYIQNFKDDVIVSSDDNLIEKYKISSFLADKIARADSKLQTLEVNKEKCLVSSSIINNTDWCMVTVVPYSKILSGSRSIRFGLLLLMSIIGAIAYYFAYRFSSSINNRISKLITGMRNMHDGNLDMYIENKSKDEIGQLIEDYNFMISRMSVLIEEQYKSGKEVKSAELKALQAQINPHFLYNTLDMINWMSFKNMNKEISDAVKSLAKFYKLSLNKGKNIISLRDEITHVSLYVQIQNMRYSNRINLEVNIHEDLYEYNIIKITLQPIIENSILHGILAKGTEVGTIIINAKLDNEDLLIQVNDNGPGISEDTINKILSGDIDSKKGSGYGLKNINQRIKLYYGEKYGLSFKSNLDEGTSVIIRIPAQIKTPK